MSRPCYLCFLMLLAVGCGKTEDKPAKKTSSFTAPLRADTRTPEERQAAFEKAEEARQASLEKERIAQQPLRRNDQSTTRVEVEAPGAEPLSPEKLKEQNLLLQQLIRAGRAKDYLRGVQLADRAMKNRPKDMLLVYLASTYNYQHGQQLLRGGVLKTDAEKFFLRSADLARVMRASGAKLLPIQIQAMGDPCLLYTSDAADE